MRRAASPATGSCSRRRSGERSRKSSSASLRRSTSPRTGSSASPGTRPSRKRSFFKSGGQTPRQVPTATSRQPSGFPHNHRENRDAVFTKSEQRGQTPVLCLGCPDALERSCRPQYSLPVRACPNCGKENPPEQKFCGECGGRLGSVCPSCQAENPPENKFCGECGASLGAEEPAP